MLRRYSLFAVFFIGVLALHEIVSQPARAEEGRKPVIELMNQVCVSAMSFSPDDKILATGFDNGWVSLWSLPKGGKLHSFRIPGGAVFSLLWVRDGKELVVAGDNGEIDIWDPHKGVKLRTLDGHEKTVGQAAIAPDGSLLASAGYDGEIRIWEYATGKLLRRLNGHKGRVTTVAFSPDGKRLVSGGVIKEAITIQGFRLRSTWADHLRLWDVESGKELATMETRGSDAVFSADGSQILVGGLVPEGATVANPGRKLDGLEKVVTIDMSTLQEIHSIADKGCGIWLRSDGRVSATGNSSMMHFKEYGGIMGGRSEHGLWLWEMETRSTICKLLDEQVLIASLSPRGRYCGTNTLKGRILVWDFLAGGGGPEQHNLARPDYEASWKEMGASASSAYQAAALLRQCPNESIAFMKEHLVAVRSPTDAEISELVERLDATEFKIRNVARKELATRGRGVLPLLRAAGESSKSVELRKQTEKLILKLQAEPPAKEELRTLRAIEVLEQIGTPEARALLQNLAEGAQWAAQTQQARVAIRRLDRIPKE